MTVISWSTMDRQNFITHLKEHQKATGVLFKFCFVAMLAKQTTQLWGEIITSTRTFKLFFLIDLYILFQVNIKFSFKLN